MFNLFKNLQEKFINLLKEIKLFFSSGKDKAVKVVKKLTVQYLNDPSTPDLKQSVYLPANNFMKLSVNKMTTTGGSVVGTVQWQAENAYINLVNCLNSFQKYFPANVKRWAATSVLRIFPRAGYDANAYYDRSSLKFFYFNSYVDKKMIYTIESSDIVTHELGHAILDAIRPDFWSAAAFEVGAFHESFGDLNALLSVLQYDMVLNKILQTTGGNLRQNNFVSQLAEQFGTSLGISFGLRNAFNQVLYENPATLPVDGDGLTMEVHSFSVVWTGAFYDVFVSIFEKLGKSKANLILARDIVTKLLFEAITKVPVSVKFFNSLAKCMIDADKKFYAGAYSSILTTVFKKRNILTSSDVSKLQNNISVQGVQKENYLFKNNKEIFLTTNHNKEKIKVQLACDSFHCDDKNTLNALAIFDNQEESIKQAEIFVDYLFKKDLVGNKKKHSWFIDKDNENKLTRSKIQCDSLGFRNNCTIEGQPEYGKCWKPENNSGCCPYGCPKIEPIEETVYKSCATRYSACNNTTVYSSCNNNIIS